MDNILVLGYYNRKNLGDEAYKIALPRIFPQSNLIFHNVDDTDIDLSKYKSVIVGGGDLFNEYFLKKIKEILKYVKLPVIGFSIGLPYLSCITPANVAIFDRIFTRNKQELELLQLLIGSDRVHYLPDATFIFDKPVHHEIHLEDIFKNLPSLGINIFHNQKRILGIFLAQSMSDSPNIVSNIVTVLSNIQRRNDNTEIRFYIFDTSGKLVQDDNGISKIVSSRVNGSSHFKYHKIVNEQDPLKMLDSMKDLNIAICTRFHAHIFCTILNIPFLSIANTPKVQKYLEQEDLLELSVPIVDGRIDTNAVLAKYDYLIKHNGEIKQKLNKISTTNKFLLLSKQPQILLDKTTFNDYEIPSYLKLDEDKIFAQLKPDETVEQLAQKISYLITKDPNSDYVYGTINNIKQKGFNGIPIMLKWMVEDYKNRQINKLTININYINQNIGADYHRSGWNYVVDGLKTICCDKGILLDTYLDKTFGWSREFYKNEGMIPYTSPWMGFIHHTFETTFSENNNVNVLKSDEFLRSLPTCRGLFVLSKYLQEKWQKELALREIKVPVFHLVHPTTFDCIPFKLNWSHNYKLVTIGAWLRNPITFYRLKTGGIEKIALKGKSMENFFPTQDMVITKNMLISHNDNIENKIQLAGPSDIICRIIGDISTFIRYLIKHLLDLLSVEEIFHLHNLNDDIILDFSKNKYDNKYQDMLLQYTKKIISSVTIVNRLSNQEYDKLLSGNVVFIDLLDASTSNTLNECVIRNTPIIVNSLPSVIEILGKDYPLYYNGQEDISRLLQPKIIERAHKYLKKLDKSPFRIETFISEFSKKIEELH